MIICKYAKIGSAVFVPHLDLLRAVGMAIRRQSLHINYSEGFNPHAKIYFGQPLPIGTESLCEYFCVDSKNSAQEFMDKLNTSLPSGIEILKSAELEVNPNIANLMARADYEVKIRPSLPKNTDFTKILESETLIISYIAKDIAVTKDVKSMVFDVKNDLEKIYMTVACGNVNLRADRLANHLLKTINHFANIDIKKTAMYDISGKNLDEIFFIKE